MPATAHPLVSVIIPVYNVEKYLPRCLDSVIAQTEKNLEIICVDDGSTDSSGAILAEYAAKDPRIVAISQENHGQAYARNRAMDVMSGKFFMFVDSDDAVRSRTVERLLGAMEETGADISVNRRISDMSCMGSPQTFCGLSARRIDHALQGLVGDRRIFSSVWNKLYSSTLASGLRFKVPSHYFEDWPFLLKIFARSSGYALIDEPLYCYNRESLNDRSTVRGAFSVEKAGGYIAGIRDVVAAFSGPGGEAGLPFVVKRCAVAAKMLIGKSWRSGPEVRHAAVAGLRGLFADGLLHRGDLDLKSWFRLWRMERSVPR
jgi:glycosyltransferase involved in cell wall biosynthesis